MRLRILCLLTIALALLSTSLRAQTTRPSAMMEPETPESKAVRAAASEYMLSLAQDDIGAARKLFAGSDDDFKSVQKLHEAMGSVKHLREAMAEKFPDVKNSPMRSKDFDAAALSERMQRVPVKIQGDTAKMADGTTLKQIDGQWKVVDMFANETNRSRLDGVFQATAKAADETITEIKEGKYPTAAEASKALNMRMMTAMRAAMGMNASTRPASRPTSSSQRVMD